MAVPWPFQPIIGIAAPGPTIQGPAAPLPIGGGTNGLGVQGVAIKGQPLGVFYGGDFVRCGRGLNVGGIDLDNTAGECQGAARNALYIDGTGYPQLDASASYVVGNPNPDWTGALRTGFRWKHLRFGGLLDIRQGGQASNSTRGALNHFGTSKEISRSFTKLASSVNWLTGPLKMPPAPVNHASSSGTAVPAPGPATFWPPK